MKKTYCDQCTLEVDTEYPHETLINIKGGKGLIIDLCQSCVGKLLITYAPADANDTKGKGEG